MILVVLICTLIGYLCGSALIGLGVGLLAWLLSAWVSYTPAPVYRRRKAFPRRRRK